MTLTDLFLFVVLPYAAVGQLLPALLFRRRPQGALLYAVGSTELTAERSAFWTRPGWIGAIVLLALHLVPFLFARGWSALIADQNRLVVVELIGLVGGLLFLFGVGLILKVRLFDGRLSPLKTSIEVGALAALCGSAVAGLFTAVTLRWGSAWYTHVIGPYLWSLARLQPDVAPLAALGFWPRAHVALAFVAMALVPFTTLPNQLRAPVLALFRRRPHAAVGGAP